jgi:hypothetical protein
MKIMYRNYIYKDILTTNQKYLYILYFFKGTEVVLYRIVLAGNDHLIISNGTQKKIDFFIGVGRYK